MKTKTAKANDTTNTITTKNDADGARDEFAIYCNLLHGWFKQPERFEQFAARCADNAKLALTVAKAKGLA